MKDILSQIPSLEDHVEYKACLDRIAEFETRLQDARNEHNSLGDGPQVHGAHHDDDLDAEVAKPLQASERHEKARIRAQMKVQVLERSLQAELERVPGLRQQAEDFVGRAASELHQKSVARLLDLKREMTAEHQVVMAIRRKVRDEINKQTPGYKAWQLTEKYVWGRNSQASRPTFRPVCDRSVTTLESTRKQADANEI